MTYVNDACAAGSVVGDLVPFNIATQDKSISEFLAMPIRVATGTLTANVENVWTQLFDRTFLLSNSLVAKKLIGYSIMSATVVVRVEVSTTPFVAGLLKLWHLDSLHPNNEIAYRYTTRTGVSQLQGVELDLALQTAVELRVGYQGPYAGMSLLVDSRWNHGRFGLFNVIPPSVAPTTPLPTYSIYVSLEDVKLFNRVPENLALLTPQSNPIPVPGKIKKVQAWEGFKPLVVSEADHRAEMRQELYRIRNKIDEVYLLLNLIVARNAHFEAQMGGSSSGELKPSGLVSSALMATSKAASALGSIPMLRAYMHPLSWATRTVSGLASSFGWSKPVNNAMTRKVRDFYCAEVINCDGEDIAYNLGNQSDNTVKATTTVSRSMMDETAFAYLNQVPAIISAFSLSTQTAGTCVYACQLCPRAMWFQAGRYNTSTEKQLAVVNNLTAQGILPTSVCALSHCFANFRGGFKFTFKMAKTKYHAGRVVFTYTPIHPTADTSTNTQFLGPATFTETSFQERVTVDLREGNEITVEVPYAGLAAYSPASLGYGWLSMWISEPVTGPTTVATAIPIVVEVSALPGFELSTPIRPQLWPVSPDNAGPVRTLVAQSNSVHSLGKIAPTGIAPAEHCVGEVVQAAKQLASLPYWCSVTNSDPAPDTLDPLNPFLFRSGGTGALPSSDKLTMLDYFAPWYRSYRGGVVVRAYGVSPYFQAAVLGPDTSVYSRSVAPASSWQHNTSLVVREKDNILSVYVPQYGCAPYRQVGAGAYDSQDPDATTPVVCVVNKDSAGGLVDTFRFTRVAGDDFQFGGFLGAPPIVYTPGGTTPDPLSGLVP